MGGREYDVAVDVGEVDGAYDCVGLSVRARDGRVDGGVMRSLRVAELVRTAALAIDGTHWGETMFRQMAPAPSAATRLSESHIVSELDEATGRYVNREITTAAPPLTSDEEEREVIRASLHAAATDWRRMVREASRAGGQTRLQMAAEIYKRAQRRNMPPTRAVADELDITYPAAVSLVRRCRTATPPLLPPASGAKRVSKSTQRRRPTDGKS